jgi:microcystin-dependent protein
MEKFNVKNGLSVGVDKLSIIDAVGSLSAASVTVNGQYTLPSLDGTSSQVIATDGGGNLSFISLSSAKYDSAYTSFNSNSASYIKNGAALGTPSSGTLTNCTGLPTAGLLNAAVTTAKLANDSVTLDKMASGSTGELISYDDSGDPMHVGAGVAGAVLTSQGGANPPIFQAVLPAGIVSPYAGTTAPTGWLLCAGQTVSRTTYAVLFAVVSTTYGAGNGSTTFTLPDLRGRVPAGKDNMNGTDAGRLTNALLSGVDGDTLGAVGGDDGHQLSVPQMPAHTHTYTRRAQGSSTQGGSGSRPINATETLNSGSTGGGAEHNNVQPTIILNYIIKT